jgi:hypothetical protein
VDVPLVILASCMLLFGAVLAYVGLSYQPERTPLAPAQPPMFRVAAKSLAVAGVLLLGFGALGFGGFALFGVLLVALRTARV